MNKPDNHIDELQEAIKLDEFLDDYVDELNNEKTHGDLTELHKIQDEWLAQLDQYYADFYRNKILEARIDELTDFVETSRGGFRSLADIRASMEVRLDNLTTQLNSKGDNDE